MRCVAWWPVALSLLCPIALAAPEVFPPYRKPTLIAHRGASGDAPEHTLAAYSLALKQGADFVEPDLQLTCDGELVCLHDPTLERTTNVAEVFPDRAKLVDGKKTWPVIEFTLAEVQRLDAGTWKGKQFAGARVPTFKQMIDAVQGKAGIMPEIKAAGRFGRNGHDLEKLLLAALKTAGLDAPGADPKTPVVIQSFDADSLKTLRRDRGCKLPLVYLMRDEDAGTAAWQQRLRDVRAFADGIAPNKAMVLAHPKLVRDAHDLGLSVTVWTFRAGQTGKFKDVREEMVYFLRELKADALFTDHPDRFPRD